ncbi:MAG: SDR family oxidoreductase [Pseudomonadota bacterium]|nr:SDR family oxidoreductase [Pseudomonadota bacterium]
MAEGKLAGKVAMMTGAGRGLGRAMALALAGEGAQLALVDLDGDELQDVASEVQNIGGRENVIPLGADVCDPDSSATAIHYTVENYGRLDILFNNAALGPQVVAADPYGNPPKFWELDPFTFIRMVDVNAAGPQLMAAAAAPHMMRSGWGRIINVTTALDAMYVPGMGGYGPSKAALEAHTAIMAKDLEGTGVTANVLIPGGPANTRMIPDATGIPRDALIQPEDMQAPAVWLASEESDGHNGERFIAGYWAEGLKKASAPCAWPQLGKQAILPKSIRR